MRTRRILFLQIYAWELSKKTGLSIKVVCNFQWDNNLMIRGKLEDRHRQGARTPCKMEWRKARWFWNFEDSRQCVLILSPDWSHASNFRSTDWPLIIENQTWKNKCYCETIKWFVRAPIKPFETKGSTNLQSSDPFFTFSAKRRLTAPTPCRSISL